MDWEKCKSFALQLTALVCVNVLAFLYDGEYIPVAIGTDALVLGFNVAAIKK